MKIIINESRENNEKVGTVTRRNGRNYILTDDIGREFPAVSSTVYAKGTRLTVLSSQIIDVAGAKAAEQIFYQ